MGLPWFRMDSSIASHDKILALLSDPSPKRWQAFTSYVCAIGWSAEHGTDGRLTAAALPFIHGTKATAGLLVAHRLWLPVAGGWEIRNYLSRQEMAAITAGKQEAARVAAQKANCSRWHGSDCWSKEGCSRV